MEDGEAITYTVFVEHALLCGPISVRLALSRLEFSSNARNIASGAEDLHCEKALFHSCEFVKPLVMNDCESAVACSNARDDEGLESLTHGVGGNRKRVEGLMTAREESFRGKGNADENTYHISNA